MAKMHQTTVRFSPDLWELVESECAALGVSIAQYLREAAIARLAYSAARRDERVYAAALEEATAGRFAADARQAGEEQVKASAAVFAQSKLARERARVLRLEALSARARHARAQSGDDAQKQRSTPRRRAS